MPKETFFWQHKKVQPFQAPSTEKLVVYKDQDSGLLVCGGHVQIFKEAQFIIPILPYDTWVTTLLAQEFTSVDLFGPHQVEDDVKKRVALKVWGRGLSFAVWPSEPFTPN